MEWHSFLLEAIQTLAWPVTIIIIVAMLRIPLASLLPTLQAIRYKDTGRDFEVMFGKELVELQKRAEQVQLPPPDSTQKRTQQEFLEYSFGANIDRLAIVSPRAAIVEAWVRLEDLLRRSATRFGEANPRTPLLRIGRILEEQGIIPRGSLSLLEELQQLRNQAVHFAEFELQSAQAIEYVRLAERFIAALELNQGTRFPRQDKDDKDI